ncbi:Dual-specificity protein phosphatase [Golovinomyces cichoracearum]|uniref:protein-tyrosine-phosphatase n=1 Tax=Golovinomyces cichoracearum TaxID=62708 RepID=A0A420I0B8_9PEZI|nr:Dual-specificity protein phosphatase [Golovinomyces cichoracearum]
MNPLPTLPNPNSRTLKRSFTAVTLSPSHERSVEAKTQRLFVRRHKQRADGLTQMCKREPNYTSALMSATSGTTTYENHLSSFISMYSIESPTPRVVCWNSSTTSTTEISSIKTTSILPDVTSTDLDQNPMNEAENNNIIPANHNQKNDLTLDQDSPDSSPTITIFTNDSSLSDPSPTSSPDYSNNSETLGCGVISNSKPNEYQNINSMINTSSQFKLCSDKSTISPISRKKNPKSLALKLTPKSETSCSSEPPSPSFIKPPAMRGKKKPNLLSLNTGAANNNSHAESVASPRLPSMLQRRGLKHSVSTPQMVFTPMFCPTGGMTLRPHMRPTRFGNNKSNQDSSNNNNKIQEDIAEETTGVQMATRLPGVTVGGDTFDRAHSSEDESTATYPDGPILMHEPSLYLFSEPELDEILKFDVVINVAREVKCPFEITKTGSIRGNRTRNPQSFLKRASTTSGLNKEGQLKTCPVFISALETNSIDLPPKTHFPEYIHIPWDHNTDVKDELWDLCELIEDRLNNGKKVLVHCQQGASRSATLIIAYGMYVNKEIGPNESYQIAQAKSPWVNPNMSLLFSLNDFKKVIDRKKHERSALAGKDTPNESALSSTESSSIDATETSSDISESSTYMDNFVSPINTTQISCDDGLAPNSVFEMDSTISRLDAFEFGFPTLLPK